MNQVLKERVYGMGTRFHVEYMANLGGMNEEERAVLMLLHEKKKDKYIEDTLSLSKTTRERVESAIAAKLLLAVFQCINYHIDHADNID